MDVRLPLTEATLGLVGPLVPSEAEGDRIDPGGHRQNTREFGHAQVATKIPHKGSRLAPAHKRYVLANISCVGITFDARERGSL